MHHRAKVFRLIPYALLVFLMLLPVSAVHAFVSQAELGALMKTVTSARAEYGLLRSRLIEQTRQKEQALTPEDKKKADQIIRSTRRQMLIVENKKRKPLAG